MSAIKLTIGTSSKEISVHSRVLIGRDPQAVDLLADHGSVSRRHAELFMDGAQLMIRDLGSSNGTWLNKQPVGTNPTAVSKGAEVLIGHQPLAIEWPAPVASTQMFESPIAAKAAPQKTAFFGAPIDINALAQGKAPAPAAAVAPAAPAKPADLASGLGVGGKEAPTPKDFAYRRQGSNNNGVLLIALRSDTYSNDAVLDGYLEFTSLDNETVNSITIELVECHKKGPSKGHVWDRMLVRQGPWKMKKNDVVPLPFQLRIPPGTSISGRDVHWELRGYVDINWGFDIEATSPITMRNTDIERLRDALGFLDYRMGDLESLPLGQRFTGTFQPPIQLSSKWGISDINLEIEYLAANIKMRLEVEKTSLFKFDKNVELVFELARFRSASKEELSTFLKQQIDEMMAK